MVLNIEICTLKNTKDMRKFLTILFLIFLSVSANAEQFTFNLDSCRALAIRNNKNLRISSEKQRKAYYDREAAFTNYLPRVSAEGAYIHTGREMSILNNDQKSALGNLGTNAGQQIISAAQQNPILAEIVSKYSSELTSATTALNSVGQSVVDAFRTDTRNMTVGAVMLTQPIYMGGKIVAYNKITKYAEQIAQNQHDLALQDVIVEVDQAYWQIVSLKHKKKLAQSYLDLVKKLDDDVQKMIKEGVATKADGLSVKVKVNEAEVTMIQVDNGLFLSKMLLCQICGLDMASDVTLADEDTESFTLPAKVSAPDVDYALNNRPELKSLDLLTKINKEKANVARAEFLPSVALTGGYLVSNPSVFNGFEKKFKGTWNVGVMVKIPILTFGERNYKYKSAQADAIISDLQREEAKEKIELQVNQCNQKLQEATERLATATRSKDEADENLRYAELGMKEGVIPIRDVLAAQTAWLSAHSTCVTAQIDVMLADVYLRKSLGTLK